MTFAYDPQAGGLATACSLGNTVLPRVLRSQEYWLFLGLHLTVWIAHRQGLFTSDGSHEWSLHWTYVSLIGGLTSFLAIFYTNQCYDRYNQFYTLTKGVFNDAIAYASLLRMSVRYLIASIQLHFSEVRGEDVQSKIDELGRRGFLRPAELQVLAAQGGHQSNLHLLSWCAQAAHAGCKTAAAPAAADRELIVRLWAIQGRQRQIRDMLALPVPFQYFHLLHLMVMCHLSLCAYSMGLTDSVFAPFVFACATVIYLGLVELAAELADPFGDDAVDFPVEAWIDENAGILAELVESQGPCTLDELKLGIPEEQPLRRGPLERSITRRKTRTSTCGTDLCRTRSGPCGTSLCLPQQEGEGGAADTRHCSEQDKDKMPLLAPPPQSRPLLEVGDSPIGRFPTLLQTISSRERAPLQTISTSRSTGGQPVERKEQELRCTRLAEDEFTEGV